MFSPKYGDKSELPYIMFGKKDKDSDGSGDANKKCKIKFKPNVSSWRSRNRPTGVNKTLSYVDISNNDKHLIEDVLIPLLRVI